MPSCNVAILASHFVAFCCILSNCIATILLSIWQRLYLHFAVGHILHIVTSVRSFETSIFLLAVFIFCKMSFSVNSPERFYQAKTCKQEGLFPLFRYCLRRTLFALSYNDQSFKAPFMNLNLIIGPGSSACQFVWCRASVLLHEAVWNYSWGLPCAPNLDVGEEKLPYGKNYCMMLRAWYWNKAINCWLDRQIEA